MALGSQVIDLIGLQAVDQFDQVHGVRQVAIVQKQMRIGVDMLDARCVECTRAANDAVNLVAFFEKQIGEITSVLSGDAGDEGFLHF
jgi:hypothetical protein